MRGGFCGKVGIITTLLISLSMVGWSGAQEGRASGPIVRGPFYVALGIGKVAVFPLSDRSHRECFALALNWGGSERVVEKISEYLAAKGVMVSDQRKVSELLVSRGMINLMEDVSDPHSFAWNLANRPHRPLMAQTLMKSLLDRQGSTSALSKEEVAQIGKSLGADMIIRGRILEKGRKVPYSELFEKYGDPLLEVVPFRLMEIGPDAVGYALYKGYEAELPTVDTAKAVRLAEPPQPTAESSALEITIWLQNAKTGEVEWSGRVELACPLDYDGKAIESKMGEGIGLLLDDFFENYLFLYRGEWLCIREMGGAR